jgi:hypothetical protein
MAHFIVKTYASHSTYVRYGSLAMLNFSLDCAPVCAPLNSEAAID